MFRLNTRKIKQEIIILRQVAIPGMTVLFIIIIARLSGLLQGLELILFDTFLRLRPAEITDPKIVIIGINENDIRSLGTYPVPDAEIASLIQKIQIYKPAVIGLDIVKNVPIEPGHQELIKAFQQYQNLIGIEKVLPPDEISPPPNLPPKQIGFSDVIADRDGNYRRYLLLTASPQNPENPQDDKYSLALRLAQGYLATKNIIIDTGKYNSYIRFADIELPIFSANTGGYVGENDTGLKMLVNFRSGKQPFRFISLNDIKSSKFDPNWLKQKIIIIGVTAASSNDLFNTSATNSSKIHSQIYGVEFHAHVTSQIINAVVNDRPLLKVWSDGWEYLWLVIWGVTAIIIARVTETFRRNLLTIILIIFCLISISYLLILLGWWIPLAPTLLILGINGLGISVFAFHEYKQNQIKIQLSQHTIEHTFTLIHNGPLQTLANILRQVGTDNLQNDKLILQLEKLNSEIRSIGEYLRIEALTPNESLRLGSRVKIDLKRPIHELFYEVYTSTIARDDLEYFYNINVKVRTFEPIDEKYLNIEKKQELCLFLEEALCNVGKHAKGVKRIEAIGKKERSSYTLMIKDNGCGLTSFSENKGMKQLKNIAKKLGGNFKCESLYPKGTICEVTWKLTNNKNNYLN